MLKQNIIVIYNVNNANYNHPIYNIKKISGLQLQIHLLAMNYLLFKSKPYSGGPINGCFIEMAKQYKLQEINLYN